MPIETNRLKLPLPLGNESVSRVGINNIFEKIDEGVATREDVEELRQLVNEVDIPDASLTEKGKVQLSSKTNGDREDVAATEKAVGEVMAATRSAQGIINNRDGYGTTTNNGNAYSVNLTPAPTAYVDGLRITVKINAANTGTVTINVNGLGAKSVLKSNGGAMTANALRANSVYSLVYNGTVFILQGEGGTGNAQPEDVVLGKTFTNDEGEAVGTRVSYVAGDMLSYTKMGFSSPPTVSNYFKPNTSVRTETLGMCLAKDSTGYYVSYKDGTSVHIAKFNNFGVVLWTRSLGQSDKTNYGLPISGSRDGGVIIYIGETGRNYNTLVKFSTDGTFIKRININNNNSAEPQSIDIDDEGSIFLCDTATIRYVTVKDDLIFNSTTSTDVWTRSFTGTRTAVVVDSTYLYYASTTTAIARLTKSTGIGSGAHYPLADGEYLIGQSMVMDRARERFYVGTSKKRIMSAQAGVYNWIIDVEPTNSSDQSIYNIFANQNEIYVTYSTTNKSSVVKIFSHNSNKLGEFDVFVKSPIVVDELERQTSIGHGIVVPPTSNNIIVGLGFTTNAYLRNLQINA